MKENDIGKLYKQKFENFEVPVSAQEWAFVKSGVAKSAAGKSGFLSFSAQHFNIYYLAAANVLVGSAVSVAVYKYNQSQDAEKENNPAKEILLPVKEEEKKDSIVYLYEESSPVKQENNTGTVTEKSSVSQTEQFSKPDTSHTSTQLVPATTEIKQVSKDTVSTLPKIAPKKPVIINKRDTIVVTDTVDTPPDKKRKRK